MITLPESLSYAESLYKRGAQEFADGRRAKAVESFREALSLDGRNPAYLNALGHALFYAGQREEAERYYTQAVKIDPNYALAWRNLGNLRLAAGDPQRACEALARAVTIAPKDEASLQMFMDAFSMVRFTAFNDWIKNVVIFCLKNDGVEHRAIATAWAWFFEIDPAFEDLRNLKTEIPGNLDDPFLTLALRKLRVRSFEFEKIMTKLRGILLKRGSEDCDFLCDLAMQCWINEHVYAVSDEEKKLLAGLKKNIEAKIDDAPGSIAKICLYACYEPLLGLKNAEKIFEKLKNSGSAHFQNLLKLHIADPLEERAIRETIRSANITDGVSKKVRAQYEESPYPRWKRVAGLRKTDPAALDILIAGCGTGSHSAQTALECPNARIHNIDLSLTSLAYAVRQTREAGLKNLTFEQADILNFKTDKKFDRIESIGVLHHMDKPGEGLRALKKLLKPDGEMSIGLYSENARRDVAAARDYIQKKGYGDAPEDIRKIRYEISAHENPLIAECAKRYDFFTTSSCRDLLLHKQEWRFTIPGIGQLLKDSGLVLAGFKHSRDKFSQMFKARFPEENAAIDIGKWEIFEHEHPSFFSGMYIFAVRHA